MMAEPSDSRNALVRFLGAVAHSRRNAAGGQLMTVKLDEWTGVVTVRDVRDLLEWLGRSHES